MDDPSIKYGDQAYAQGDLDQALEHYDLVLSRDKSDVRAWIGRARILRDRGLLGDAEDAYIRAVEVEPNNARAWIELVTLELDGGAEEVAAENLAAALRLHPGHAELVDLHTRVPGAEIDSDDKAVLQRLRDCLFSGQGDDAEALIATLSQRPGAEALTLVARSEHYLSTGEGAALELIHDLTRVTRSEPNNWLALTTLGRLHLCKSPLRNVRLAVALCEDAWRISAEHRDTGLGLVEAWSAIGKHSLAHALCQRLASEPDHAGRVAQRWLDALDAQ